MKKSSYILLFITCFAVISFYNSLWLLEPDFSAIMAVILLSLVETLVPYLIIILIIHIVNRDSRSA